MANKYLTKIALNRYEEHLLGRYSKPSEVPAIHDYRYRAAMSSHMGHGENQRGSVNRMLPLAREQSRTVHPDISSAVKKRAKLPVIPVNLPKDKSVSLLGKLGNSIKSKLLTKIAFNRYEQYLLDKYPIGAKVPSAHRARHGIITALQVIKKPEVSKYFDAKAKGTLEHRLSNQRKADQPGVEKPKSLNQRIQDLSKPTKKVKLPTASVPIKTPLTTKVLRGLGGIMAVSSIGYGIKKLVDE